jgi:hypothetical protein
MSSYALSLDLVLRCDRLNVALQKPIHKAFDCVGWAGLYQQQQATLCYNFLK